MKALMVVLIVLTILIGGIGVLMAYTKTETDSQVAGSVVLYGMNGTTLVPLKVSSDGTLAATN